LLATTFFLLSGRLTAYLAHRAGFRMDSLLEFVAYGLGPDGLFKKGYQVLVSAPITQRITQIDFLIG
jgi:hypothetical protein